MAFTLLEFYYDFDLLKSSWRQEKKKIKKETSVSSFWKKKQKNLKNSTSIVNTVINLSLLCIGTRNTSDQ